METYAPVVDSSTVGVAFTIAVKRGYIIHQMDVKTESLHVDIDREVYLITLRGSDICVPAGHALKLQKGLNGFKESPKLWMNTWKELMRMLHFNGLASDP